VNESISQRWRDRTIGRRLLRVEIEYPIVESAEALPLSEFLDEVVATSAGSREMFDRKDV
jgi:hypothetical protein